MLTLLRPYSDDVVVAVDHRGDARELGPLLDVADTVARFEYVDSPEQARPWLVGLCRNRWVLMIDGDEVPSGELLAALPGLTETNTVKQHRLARRWCFPDERHWLAERPWWPDFQKRLFLQDASLDFDAAIHGGVRHALPARYLSASLYHLACVQRSFAERRARAREFERRRPGLVAVGGGPMNETLYVPEHFATLRPVATPADDVERIRTVRQAKASRATRDPGIPVVSADEIASHLDRDPLAGQGYLARIRVVEADCRTEPGNDTLLLVEVVNLGPEPIPHEDRVGLQVRVGTRILDPDTGSVLLDGARTPLPCDIPVGEGRLVEALVPVPDAPGIYSVEFDLLNERSRWFGQPTSAELVVATRWGRFGMGSGASRR